MRFTREEFEAALATVPEGSLAEDSWLWRVNDWQRINEMGALQAAYLRRWRHYVDLRKLAPQFHDWLLEVFPESEDQRLLQEHTARIRDKTR